MHRDRLLDARSAIARRWGVVLIVFGLAVAAIIGFAQWYAAGGPELVHNGSFETGYVPKLGDNGFESLCGGTDLDQWQVTRLGAASQECTTAPDAIAVFVNGNTPGVSAEDGRFFVDLTGVAAKLANPYGKVEQDVAGTKPDTWYELAFYIGSSSKFLPPSQVGISAEAANVTRKYDAPTTDQQSYWERRAFLFKASSTTTRIALQGDGPAGPKGVQYVGLDNVSVREVCWIVRAVLYGC